MYPPPLPRHHFPQSKNTKHVIVDSDDPPLRLYQVWKGRNKFFCGGRVIFGPDVKSIFVTLSLILVPLIFFWTFVSKGLIIVFPHGWGIAIIAFSGILAAQVVILLFLTSGSDPGIIPRNAQPPAPEPDDSDSTLSADWGASQSIAPSRPMTRNVTVNGVVVKVKYCQTCKLYRPPRCSHCSICNNCVERFDHHCPWVGQCIGKRNYRYFVLFVSTTSILCSYVLICCFVNIMRIADKYNCSAWDAVRRSPVSGILVVYTFVVCWFVGGLTTFHLYLIATNQTTYENFRYRYDRKMNPYNLGFSRNCQQVFCSKIPSSRNDFREKVNRDDSSYDFGFSTYPSQEMRIKMATRKFDIQMVNQAGLDADDFEDIRSNVGSLSRLERCSTEPRRNEWDRRSNWDVMSPDHV